MELKIICFEPSIKRLIFSPLLRTLVFCYKEDIKTSTGKSLSFPAPSITPLCVGERCSLQCLWNSLNSTCIISFSSGHKYYLIFITPKFIYSSIFSVTQMFNCFLYIFISVKFNLVPILQSNPDLIVTFEAFSMSITGNNFNELLRAKSCSHP